MDAYEGARARNKFCLFFDTTNGNVATFFYYKARLKDFNKEIMKVQSGNKTKEDAVEVVRDGIMWAGKVGDTLAVNFEGYVLDFKNE